MTVKECYAAMNADYEDVMRRLVSEERVRKFLFKLPSDGSFSLLTASLGARDYAEAFRAAHSIKGICMNLGLSALQRSSAALTENLRGGRADGGTAALYAQTETDYRNTMAAIQALLDG